MKFMTTADKILIALIVVLSITSIFAIPRLLTKPMEGKEVVINMDGQVIHHFPLEDTEESVFIDFPFEYKNKEYKGRLEMKEGRVRLLRLADEISPLSIHADMGWISESYQTIVSLPIKMFISIEEAGTEYLFDTISF